MSPQELATNEKLLAEERGVELNDPEMVKKLYGDPEQLDDMGGAGGLGDLGGSGGGGMDMAPDDDLTGGDDLDGDIDSTTVDQEAYDGGKEMEADQQSKPA